MKKKIEFTPIILLVALVAAFMGYIILQRSEVAPSDDLQVHSQSEATEATDTDGDDIRDSKTSELVDLEINKDGEVISDNQGFTVEVIEPEAKIRYKVTLIADWSKATHPDAYVSTAHMSPMVVWMEGNARVFQVGGSASKGIEEVAETGKTDRLTTELNIFSSNNAIGDFVVGQRFDAPGSNSVEIAVDETHSQLALISMLAPTPDWFVGAYGVQLRPEGQWVNKLTLDLSTYDAGTEEGTGFSIDNADTVPRGQVDLLTDIPAADMPAFGRVVIERVQ